MRQPSSSNRGGPSCGWRARRQAVHSVAAATLRVIAVDEKAIIISVMPFGRAHVSLLSAPDDPWIASGTLQSVLDKFRRFLSISGIENTTPMLYQDSGSAAEGYSGEFIIPLTRAGRPPVATIVSAWLEERPGRAVRLSVGESVAVTRSTREAQLFLRHAQKLWEKPLHVGEAHGRALNFCEGAFVIQGRFCIASSWRKRSREKASLPCYPAACMSRPPALPSRLQSQNGNRFRTPQTRRASLIRDQRGRRESLFRPRTLR